MAGEENARRRGVEVGHDSSQIRPGCTFEGIAVDKSSKLRRSSGGSRIVVASLVHVKTPINQALLRRHKNTIVTKNEIIGFNMLIL